MMPVMLHMRKRAQACRERCRHRRDSVAIITRVIEDFDSAYGYFSRDRLLMLMRAIFKAPPMPARSHFRPRWRRAAVTMVAHDAEQPGCKQQILPRQHHDTTRQQ